MWSNIWDLQRIGLDSYGLSGINPKYFTTADSCGMFSGDIVFQKQA
ncbi:MAG TPA: hypothetical protein VMW42_09635 [Desulfatiglandales bacterium]|nr:hypothetical protein [Desulfatiglandales bacterium]